MLTDDSNEKCKKIKKTLHIQHIFFVHFFAIVLHDFTYVRFMEEKSCMLLYSTYFFYFTAAHFNPGA